MSKTITYLFFHCVYAIKTVTMDATTLPINELYGSKFKETKGIINWKKAVRKIGIAIIETINNIVLLTDDFFFVGGEP